jgi:uncharacterized protein
MLILYKNFLIFIISCTTIACNQTEKVVNSNILGEEQVTTEPQNSNFYRKVSDHAIALTKQKVTYDAAYFTITYPNGDVPADKGVCTDVVIRTYRKLGIDLQKEVHEDMLSNFSKYPQKWGLKSTDKNIDHRRVPNLMKFFERKNAKLPTTTQAKDYAMGDIVCWDLGGGLTHIGIVIATKTSDKQRNLIVHNIGNGQEISDCLFQYKIIGHYRFKN